MSHIKYPQGKYDKSFLIVSSLFCMLFLGWRYFKEFDTNLGMGVFIMYLTLTGLYKLKTPLLLIKDGIISLDRGIFHKKLSIAIADIINVESFELNHEMIKIIFNMQSGNQIDYKPPMPHNSELLEKILVKINESLNKNEV